MHCENSPTGAVMYLTFQQPYLPQEGRLSQRANSTKTNKANCRDLFCAIFQHILLKKNYDYHNNFKKRSRQDLNEAGKNAS